MSGGFKTIAFKDMQLADQFFDSLRQDYPEFSDWFTRKAAAGEDALVYSDDAGVGAFVYLKDEDETLPMIEEILPKAPRLKIGTLKIADRIQGERLGEGAIGLALWRWQQLGHDEVYVTVFEQHAKLVGMLKRFGFARAGSNANGESVYIKDRRRLDCSDPYKAFPFLTPHFREANLLVIEDQYHDDLFPYSEVRNAFLDSFRTAAANGVTKIYVGSPSRTKIAIGQPVLVYRKYTGDQGTPGRKSVITSYCMVTDTLWVKRDGQAPLSLDDYLARVKNKSVFAEEQLVAWYRGHSNLLLIEMVYLGYFGAGHNVNWMTLKDGGYWQDKHPYMFSYTKEQFFKILRKGDVRIENAVVDQPAAR